jgi:PhzF family phenazine biosynthesis protein
MRYVAFSEDPTGGNPAGVVLDGAALDVAAMARIASDVGFSETAFLTPRESGSFGVRYFSPLVEVPFCGHATIALAIAYAERYGAGELRLSTVAGPVTVNTARTASGALVATLVTVPPRSAGIPDKELAMLLQHLRWPAEDLDRALPPRAAYAGAWHPVIAAVTRARLTELDYDMPALADLMTRMSWATIDLIWRESELVFHARNPFPPGGVVEDPATGAAAAALGGYLRELHLIPVPATITVYQGDDMGRPGAITVHIPADPGTGLQVSGTAVRI